MTLYAYRLAVAVDVNSDSGGKLRILDCSTTVCILQIVVGSRSSSVEDRRRRRRRRARGDQTRIELESFCKNVGESYAPGKDTVRSDLREDLHIAGTAWSQSYG